MYLNYTHLKKLLGIIFPPSHDEVLLKGVTSDDLLTLMKHSEDAGVRTILPYHNPRVRSAIHLLKFYNQKHARQLLGTVLSTYLSTRLTATPAPLIIPIPLSSQRLRKRGYNQVTEVLKEAQKIQYIGTLTEGVLVRTRHTKPQTSLSREKRLENMEHAFSIPSRAKALKYVTNQHIILLDDVTTTGATLRAAKAAILPHSPTSVTCIALAH